MGVPDIAAGAVIDGKYRLDRPIGEGGIGTVWAAWQELVQRKVAIKFLRTELAADQRDRFLVEARALGRLNHPNCITIYDFGYSEPHAALYLVMEHLDGFPLSEWRGREVPITDVLEIARQIANALAYAHHQTVFHRDLKPENVFLVRTYNGETLVKVLDFGLARLGEPTNDRLTKTGEIFGTPAYMSPEQIRGTRHAGAASDIYSLGIMMYEMIERRLPFDNMPPFDVMMAHVTHPVPQMRRPIPLELERVVLRCVQKDPEERYPGALELWKALSTIDVGLEEDSTNFAAVGSPDETLDGIPPAVWNPSDYESTLEDGEKVKPTYPARAVPPGMPAPTAQAIVPPADATDQRPVALPTVLMGQAQPTITAITSAPRAPRNELWLSIGVGVVGVVTVAVLLFVVLNSGNEHEAPREVPPETAAATPLEPSPAELVVEPLASDEEVDAGATGTAAELEEESEPKPASKRVKRPQSREKREPPRLRDDRRNTPKL